jgi:hypothetical protein
MSRRFLSRAGLIGLATGLLGALGALVMLLWPPQVREELVSYPFTTAGFYVAQVWFFIHHFGLVLVLVALALSGAVGKSSFARVGAWAAVIGMVALTLCELLAMRYADWLTATANATLMGTCYGISVTVIGLGMLAAGIGVLRAGAWHGWPRWTPLAIGLPPSRWSTPACSAALSWRGWPSVRGCCCSPRWDGASTPSRGALHEPHRQSCLLHPWVGRRDDFTHAASDPRRQQSHSPYSTRQWVDRHPG